MTTTVDAVEETGGNWEQVLGRLSRLSVTRHYDAFADIDWDGDELHLDPEDPRWELGPDEPLGATDWYRALPAEVRARLGCHMVASKMKLGLEFENVLKRGLLEFAMTLPSGAPEFRYAYHEVIEEAQHSLMFNEFVRRSGYKARGMSRVEQAGARWIVQLGRRFPALFFVFVLGGEDPIDHVQRQILKDSERLHPLVARIMRIHVTEEARHLSFARHYLRNEVPGLPRRKRVALAIGTPLILAAMAEMMMAPSRTLAREYNIPADLIKEAYQRNHDHRRAVAESLGKVRSLCDELGLTRGGWRWVWARLGLTAP